MSASRPNAWDDLREDARRFDVGNGHLVSDLLHIPFPGHLPSSIRQDLDLGGGFKNFSQEVAMELTNSTRRWPAPGRQMIRSSTDGPLLKETNDRWTDLCERFLLLAAPDIRTVLPESLESDPSQAPIIFNKGYSCVCATLVHWIAWKRPHGAPVAICEFGAHVVENGEPRRVDGVATRAPYSRGFPRLPDTFQWPAGHHYSGWWRNSLHPASRSLVAAIDWFRTALDAGETRRSDLPTAVEPTICKNLRDARWISKATNGGLDSEMLRKRRERGHLPSSVLRGGRYLYLVTEVAALYPQYSVQLQEAFDECDDLRKPRKGERRR